MTTAQTCALLGCEPSTVRVVAQALRVRCTKSEIPLDIKGHPLGFEVLGEGLGDKSIGEMIDGLEAEAIAGSDKAFASLGSMHDVLDALDEIVSEFQSESN